MEPGKYLSLEVGQPRRGSPDHSRSVEARLQHVEGARPQKRGKDGHDPGPSPRARADDALLRKDEQICGQQGREDDRRLLGKRSRHGRQDPDERPPGARKSLVQDERSDDADRREDLRAQRQEVQRLAVGSMDAEEDGAEEREQARPALEPGQLQDPFEEEKREGRQQDVQGPLRHVEGKRIEAASPPVVQGEGRARQRPVRRVGRIARESRRVAEEERDVVQAAQVRVVLDDGPVVEVEGIAEVVRVRREDEPDRNDAKDEKCPGARARGVRTRLRREDARFSGARLFHPSPATAFASFAMVRLSYREQPGRPRCKACSSPPAGNQSPIA